jgi:hypothetical protein
MAWALLLGGGEAQHEAVRAEAQAYAMIGLVRATPFMHQHGWLRFPHARMNAVGITALDPSTGLNALCQTLLHEAVNLLEPSRAPLPKPLRALAALAHGHAQGLLRVGGNPYAYSPQPLAMVWRVFKLRVAKIESFTNG